MFESRTPQGIQTFKVGFSNARVKGERMKPYQQVLICECGEPLQAIPLAEFAVEMPHPYEKLGAAYGDRSPYFLRAGVIERLRVAQGYLETLQPGWRIQIFDAYRPIAVQQFMVDYTLAEQLRAIAADPAHPPRFEQLSEEQQRDLLDQVYQFWAVPHLDPRTPPPHSTGAAVDVTLVDAAGDPVPMGSLIDELSPRSYPDHFAAAAPGSPAARAHAHRQLLLRVMSQAEFRRHPREWWHFSYGDQLWAWLGNQAGADPPLTARYGRAQ